MNWISHIALIIAAVIHFLPLGGLMGRPTLEKLYGIELSDPNMTIILQHRALLFGLLGALFTIAIFKADLRTLAMGFGLVSTIGFIWIALTAHSYNELILRVVKADVIVVIALIIGLVNEFWLTRQ